MADKLQQKFALVQQMKREKELREAKAKEHKPIDIFAIAGVNLAGPVHHAISRQDLSSPRPPLPRRQSTSTSVGGTTLKRPHSERSVSTSSDNVSPEVAKAISTDSSIPPASLLSSSDLEGESPAGKKLKRSSMARGTSTTGQRRPSTQGPGLGQNTGLQSPTHSTSNRRLSTSMPSAPLLKNPPASSLALSPSHEAVSPTNATATPPTPIPSPRGAKEDTASTQSSAHHPHQHHPPRAEVHHNSQSLECPEGTPVGACARTHTQPRRLSLDENSDDERPYIPPHPSARMAPDARSPPPRRYSRQESYGGSSQHSYVSRSRSPSRSPRGTSRPRSLSRSDTSHPYSPHSDDYSRSRSQVLGSNQPGHDNQHRYSRRPTENGYDRDMFRRDSAMTPASLDPTDPFGVANRCVYVGQLPATTTLDSLQKAFEVFGTIKDINFVEGVEYGFVTFKEPEAAQRAVNKASLSNVEVDTKELNPKDSSPSVEETKGVLVDGVAVEVKKAKLPGSSLESSSGDGAYLNSPPYHPRNSSSPSDFPPCVPIMKSRSVHQLPSKPRAVVPLPPKPTGAAAFPPALPSTLSADAAQTATLPGRARQILSYDDL
ncbi:hypothetical protein EMPS_00296 [Entomortierella parvispora]|uniref:RRM domain-containing protein n=1 Tax=Entomortierella parvispora TaxID=205924 RepID=A0A9P3H0E4_9FUNG|nr:hypothetical protein EMPS_00296 [Entomortierella parvispora]